MGKVHILNTRTLSVEFVLDTRTEGDRSGEKPVITCFTSYYGYCLLTLDTELTLKLFEIKGPQSVELCRSYKLVSLIKKICDHSGRKLSVLSLESSPVLIRRVGFDHIVISICKSLHLFKINSKFQLKHVSSFFSLVSSIIPYSTDQIIDETGDNGSALNYLSSEHRNHSKNSNLSLLFYVKGCFYEYCIQQAKLYEVCRTKMSFGRL